MTLPKTMTALILRQDGYAPGAGEMPTDLSPFVELAEIPVPGPREGQVLVKVARAAVNPSDLMFVSGQYGQPRKAGLPGGFEGVGEVVAGDPALLGQRVSFFGMGWGTWAQYAIADARMMIPLRPDVSDADAAGLIVNPMTAMAMFDIAREDGAGAFVFTAGGSQLGKFLIGLARDAGVAAIPVVRRAEQAPALKALGAAEVLVSTSPDFAKRAKDVFAEHGPRILLDAVADQVAANLFGAMPRGARWICYGRLATTPPRLDQMGQFIFMGKRIEGFWLTNWLRATPPETVARIVAEMQGRFASGAWRTDVSELLPLSSALERFPVALSAKDAKVQIAP
jgi:NADPH:quinone reductase-like Zn-dependent oxidoreductase